MLTAEVGETLSFDTLPVKLSSPSSHFHFSTANGHATETGDTFSNTIIFMPLYFSPSVSSQGHKA